MASKVIGFRVPEDLAEEFEQFCEGAGKTSGEMLRKLVDDVLYPESGRERLEERDEREALKNAAGRLESLEESSEALTDKIAKLEEEESDLGDRVAKLEETSPQAATNDKAVLKEKDDRIAELERRKISDFPGRDQGAFMLETFSRMPSDTVAIMVATAGKAELLTEAAAERAQAKTVTPEAEVEEQIIAGRTDKPGYQYLETLDISIWEKEGGK